MDTDWVALNKRLERLERGNQRLKALLLGMTALAVGCGATTTVANYGTLRSHTIEVFTADEKAQVLVLDRDSKGGQIVIKDNAGKARVRIDVDGVHALAKE